MPPPPPPLPPTTTSSSTSSFLASPLAHRPCKDRALSEDFRHYTSLVDPNHAAMAAALSHPFFLAAAAAASSSSRDLNEASSSSSITVPRMPSFDEHQRLASSPLIKRSISPSFLSKQNDDHTKRFASTMNNGLVHSNCFTAPPPPPPSNPSSLLSQVSKLKIMAKGNGIRSGEKEF